MKKLKLPSEIAYLLAVVLLAFSVAMLSAVDFGLSMIVAPAYVLSQKFTFLTFGQAEYVLQAILFVAFCIIVKKFILYLLCTDKRIRVGWMIWNFNTIFLFGIS